MAPDPWAGLWRNRHQIMTRLARHNIVLYVEPRLYLWETWRRLRDGRLRLADLRRPLAEHYADGLYIYHDPYYAPHAGRLSGGRLTAALRGRAMGRTLRRLGAQAPILWLLRPHQMDQIGQFGEKLIVYQVTDEYSANPMVTDPAKFLREEEMLLRQADLVIVTSPGLLVSKGRFNPYTFLVRNAVDYDGFQRALGETHGAPAAGGRAAVTAIPRPRVGYVGALNAKVDFTLLGHVARTHPEWQIVLVGELDLSGAPGKTSPMQGLPNVHWLGRLPVDQLPGAIAALDVCLLPYEQNEWTANIDSLKLYEYLACGRPVVSTDIPASQLFAHLVRVASEPGDFVGAIEAVLAEDTPSLAAERKAAAAANTWDMRVAQISDLLVEALTRKSAVDQTRDTGGDRSDSRML